VVKVLVLPDGSAGVQWWRYDNALGLLDGVEFDVWKDFEEGWVERIVGHFEASGLVYDAVWTSRFGNAERAVCEMLREAGAEVIGEVDDWFEDIPVGNMARQGWFGERRELYKDLLVTADRVVCSTPYLAERWGGQVAPNFVVPAQWDWPARPTRNPDECVLLHMCGAGRSGDFLSAEGAFRAFLDMPNTKVVCAGVVPGWAMEYPAGKVVVVRWTPVEVYTRLVRWIAPDLIVSPMLHNKFNLAKSNLKWLEAGAVGACFVGERWGEYARTVQDGVTGVLADGADEWAQALVSLALDAERRSAIAAAGQTAVYSGWTWEAVGGQWRKAVFGEGG